MKDYHSSLRSGHSQLSWAPKLMRPPPELLDRICSGGSKNGARGSRSQREASTLLEELGFVHEKEVSPSSQLDLPSNMLTIDMACRDRMVAIEFDGESHFLRSLDTPQLGLGGTVLMRRS